MRACVAAAFLCGALAWAAQNSGASADGAPVISDNVNLVVLHPVVRDGAGRFVSDLKADNFKVFENGRLQTIREFSHRDAPLAAGLLVDSSGSMGPKRPSVIAGALEFARRSNPEDQIFVLDFNEHVYSAMPHGELFSSSPADLSAAIEAAPTSGETALYDAIKAGYERLARSTIDSKALVVISDGEDNASHTMLGELLALSERSDVIVYAIGIFDEDDSDGNPGALKRIARATGGRAWFPKSASETASLCGRIAEDLRNQYTIGYSPADSAMNGTFRAITVVATDPRGHKLRVRARAGYVAAPENGKSK